MMKEFLEIQRRNTITAKSDNKNTSKEFKREYNRRHNTNY